MTKNIKLDKKKIIKYFKLLPIFVLIFIVIGGWFFMFKISLDKPEVDSEIKKEEIKSSVKNITEENNKNEEEKLVSLDENNLSNQENTAIENDKPNDEVTSQISIKKDVNKEDKEDEDEDDEELNYYKNKENEDQKKEDIKKETEEKEKNERANKVATIKSELNKVRLEIISEMESLETEMDDLRKEIEKIRDNRNYSTTLANGMVAPYESELRALQSSFNSLSNTSSKIADMENTLNIYKDYGTMLSSSDISFLSSLGINFN